MSASHEWSTSIQRWVFLSRRRTPVYRITYVCLIIGIYIIAAVWHNDEWGMRDYNMSERPSHWQESMRELIYGSSVHTGPKYGDMGLLWAWWNGEYIDSDMGHGHFFKIDMATWTLIQINMVTWAFLKFGRGHQWPPLLTIFSVHTIPSIKSWDD